MAKNGSIDFPPREDNKDKQDEKPSPIPTESLEKGNGADAERDFGIEVGNSFPISEILAESRRNEKKENELIDKNIKAKREAEAASATVVGNAFANAKPLKERKNGNGKSAQNGAPTAIETGESKTIPPELEKIYGDKVPPEKLEMFRKLQGKEKRESYLTKLAADEEEKKKRQASQKPVKDKNKSKSGPKSSEVRSSMESIKKRGLTFDLSESNSKTPLDLDLSESVPEAASVDEPVEMSENRETIPSEKKREFHKDGSEYADFTEVPKMSTNPDDAPDYIKENLTGGEKLTPGESRTLLNTLINGYKQSLEGVSERFTKSKEYLNNRAKEIDKSAEMSGLEKWTRIVGEKYNKLSLIHKLGIGVGLGTAAAVGAAFSLPIALAGLVGLVGQRSMGAAGMFVSLEKKLQEKKVGESFQLMGIKERAALDAMLYTAVMGAAISKGLELAHEYNVVERTHEWLGNMLGHHTPVHPEMAHTTVITAPVHPAAAAAVGAHEVAAAAKVEMPTVGASSHGYEGMMKDLLNKLPDKPPAGMKSDSDLAKLFEAKAHPESIGTTIHRIALDHKFFTDQGSVRIDTGAHMSVDTNGNVLFNGEIQASAGAHFTPAFPAEAPTPHVGVSTPPLATPTIETVTAQTVPASEVVTPSSGAEAYAPPPHQPPPSAAVPPIEYTPVHEPVLTAPPTITHIEASEIPFVSLPEAPVVPAEMPPTPALEMQPLPSETIVSPDTTVTTVNAPESINEPYVETPIVNTPESISEPHIETLPASAAEAVATQAPAPVIEHSFVSNQFGLSIPVGEAHIYADPMARDIFVYGGSPVERMKAIAEYLTQNPDKVVLNSDNDGEHRILWRMIEGKLVTDGAMRTNGFFGWLSSFVKAPEPDEFAKLIK